MARNPLQIDLHLVILLPQFFYSRSCLIGIVFLKSHKFVRNKYDHELYYKSGEIYITIYVDDLKLINTDDVLITNVKKLLSKKFKIKNLNLITHYLKIKIVQTDTIITLRQTSYIDQILKRYEIKNYKLISTLINANIRLCKANDKYILLKKILSPSSLYSARLYTLYINLDQISPS